MNYACIAVFILLYLPALSQSPNQKCKWIQTDGTPIILDSLSALPSSIVFSSPIKKYEHDIHTGTISVLSNEADSVQVCYKSLPISFHSSIYKRSLDAYDSNAFFKEKPIPTTTHQELFKTENIEKSGSIVRGISAGNNQDVVVNSTMDISLQGKLTDNLNIRAEITDQNVPYQPEGTTQYVQDIDHILIKIYNENIALSAGDITIRNKQDGFLRYNKRVQGGEFENKFKIGEGVDASFSIAASVAKGKFASEELKVNEGISGPYKIRPPSGERFFYIIANTEKVYLDGRLLNRGFDKDYVIDYNQSEITFTARVIITGFSRVIIDFEYADKNYSRSVIAANHAQESSKHSLFLNFYQEKDNRRNPLSLALSESDKMMLSLAGDDTHLLYSSSYDSIGYNENELLYTKTVVNGQEVFQFSTHPDSAVYRVRFMEMGSNKGNYVRQKLVGNGWVYQWVSPVNSVPQGKYEPISVLIPPTGKSMATGGGSFKLNGHEEIFAEIAFSYNDKNLFSPLDASDNKDLAYKIGVKTVKRQIGNYGFKSQLSLQSLGKHFSVIDRYDPIENNRYWDSGTKPMEAGTDFTIELNSLLENETGDLWKYSGMKRTFNNNYEGSQHQFGVAKHVGKLLFDGDYLYSFSKNSLNNSQWNRLHAGINYTTPFVIPGYVYRFEKNTVNLSSSDSIIGSAGYFNEHMVYLKSHDTLKTVFGINYALRTDMVPDDGEITNQQRSQTWSMQMATPALHAHSINGILSYRKINRLLMIEGLENDENISGSLNYSGRIWANVLSHEISYQINNGRELKREYIFIQVPTGQGHYTWIDDNNDGVQDLSEFYEAIFEDEKNYAKIYVPTDEYIVAFSNDFNLRLKYDPPGSWRNGQGILKTISRFSGNSQLVYNKRIIDDNLWQRLSPFIGNDKDVLSFRNSQRYQIYYNRTDQFYGMEIDFHETKRRQVLTNGFEENYRRNSRFVFRVNFTEGAILRLNAGNGNTVSSSDYLANRNYKIKQHELAPELEWLLNRQFRVIGKISWMGKTSDEQDQQGSADFKTLDIGLTGNSSKGRVAGVNLNYTKIDYDKPANSYLEYEMLEAMRPGNNFSWRFRLQQNLVNGLQLSMNYDGRKSESTRTIHYGRVQLTAFF